MCRLLKKRLCKYRGWRMPKSIAYRPSTIEVQIEEYQVAARWLNQGYRAGLVTPTGQIFQAETEQKIVELDSPPCRTAQYAAPIYAD